MDVVSTRRETEVLLTTSTSHVSSKSQARLALGSARLAWTSKQAMLDGGQLAGLVAKLLKPFLEPTSKLRLASGGVIDTPLLSYWSGH